MTGEIIFTRNQYAQTPQDPQSLGVNRTMEDLRKSCTLCHACTKFKPDSTENCSIAKAYYEIGRSSFSSVIVTRCGSFDPKPGIRIRRSS